MSVSTPQFTGPASGPQQGVGPTPTVFGVGHPKSVVFLFNNGEPDTVIGQGVVSDAGYWEANITLKYQNPGRANVIAIRAVYGLEFSAWGNDHILYP